MYYYDNTGINFKWIDKVPVDNEILSMFNFTTSKFLKI